MRYVRMPPILPSWVKSSPYRCPPAVFANAPHLPSRRPVAAHSCWLLADEGDIRWPNINPDPDPNPRPHRWRRSCGRTGGWW